MALVIRSDKYAMCDKDPPWTIDLWFIFQKNTQSWFGDTAERVCWCFVNILNFQTLSSDIFKVAPARLVSSYL